MDSRRVAVLCNFEKSEAKSACQTAVRWLKKNRIGAVTSAGSGALRSCEFAVVLGGDGTMLRFARALAPLGVPILGINLGRLGFLAETALANMQSAIKKALNSELEIEERMLLQVSVFSGAKGGLGASGARGSGAKSGAKPKYKFLALNDCYLHASSTNRIVEIETSLNGRFLASYTGDGLIVATPTGSTAYSLAASGPIVSPRLPVMLLTPICPHTLAQRPLVVSSEDTVELKLSGSARGMFVLLSTDGQQTLKIRKGDRVVIESAPQRAKLLVQPGRSYYEILRSKLKWGEQVGVYKNAR